MQNKLSKEKLQIFYDIIIKREFIALADLENSYQDVFSDDVFIQQSIGGLEQILLFYLYYVILTKEDRVVVPRIRSVVSRIVHNLVLQHKTDAMLNEYHYTKWEEDDIEQQLMFLEAAKIIHAYDTQAGFNNELNHNLDFEIVIKSIFSNNYCKFPDFILLTFILGYGMFNIEEKFEYGTCEKIQVLLYELIYSIFEVNLFEQPIDEFDKELNYSDNFECKANEMQIV